MKNAKRKNLVVVCAGDTSLHPQWVSAETNRNFDVFVSYFGATAGRFEKTGDFYQAARGLKYTVLADLLMRKGDLISCYESCWFPDDDLLTDSRTISEMFDLFREFNLWLAQPALSPESYVSYSRFRQAVGAKLRFSGFVEIMCPIFSCEALSILGSTFSATRSGWGLDFLWPHLLNYPRDRIAILDKTPVVHTRPIGGGTFYKQCEIERASPQEDLIHVLQKYGIKWRKRVPIYKAVQLTAAGA